MLFSIFALKQYLLDFRIMIFVQNIGLHFAGNYLFDNVSFRINKGDRIGLVGKNGAGKSTFLKILMREQEPTEGEISLEGEVSVGVLTQDIDFEYGRTLWEETELAFKEIKKLEAEIEKINIELTERTDYESDSYTKLIEDLTTKTDRFTLIGGYTYSAQIEQILLGLGFKRTDFDKLTDDFSGGWRMRIELAKLLLQKHDVMLLDEPTNHLDIDSIIWLEDFLKNYVGAVVLISHDTQFLDSVTNRTLEIANKKIIDYPTHYKRYLVLKEERREQLLSQQKNQEKEIKHTEQLIEKFRAKASKASMAQSLIKKLDRVERIEVENDDVNAMNVRFNTNVTSGKIVLEVENAAKSFADNQVFSKVDMLLTRGEKVAFVGQNGQGKSTLSRMIVGDLEGEGVIKLGHNVELGYFAQSQNMDGSRTVLEEAEHAATAESFKEVRNLLGAFLFSGDDVLKKVSVLSGGERGRLALCKLLLQPFNTLVLDEPTNHLDVQSKNILKSALKQFQGTFIVVSHDRDFMEGLVDKVYEFKEGRVKEFLGGIDDYLESREAQSFREIEKVEKIQPEKIKKQPASKEAQKIQKQLQNKIGQAERDIERYEAEIVEIEKKIAEGEATEEIFSSYDKAKKNLEEKMSLWEELNMQAE
ncbi:putative ABC transporter ATP-binding protein [Flavobacteriaceae bacterium UJ101]|nr:putative ABC transporter ATP-binding protein [Flavobacteriaceae bacterium UJ101]